MPFTSRTILANSLLDPETKKNLQNMIRVNVVAASGSTQANCTLLTAETNVVTGANATLAVRLPPAELDMSVTVLNAAAAALPVFPAKDGAINGGTADAAFAQAASTERTYYVTSLGNWYVQVA